MKERYGASPLHLVLHVALFAAFAWVALQVADAREAQNVVLWFVAAIVLHDLRALLSQPIVGEAMPSDGASSRTDLVRCQRSWSEVSTLPSNFRIA